MRKRRILDSETRRLMMAAWCRIWWGDDGWLQVDSRMITVAVLMALACLVCGCEARGDVLCMWSDVDTMVSPATDPLIVEIGQDLAGPGNPLGWIEFRSTRERGPEIIVRQIALGTSVYQAGQLLQTVPEPGTWAVLAVVCIGAALWRARG